MLISIEVPGNFVGTLDSMLPRTVAINSPRFLAEKDRFDDIRVISGCPNHQLPRSLARLC